MRTTFGIFGICLVLAQTGCPQLLPPPPCGAIETFEPRSFDLPGFGRIIDLYGLTEEQTALFVRSPAPVALGETGRVIVEVAVSNPRVLHPCQRALSFNGGRPSLLAAPAENWNVEPRYINASGLIAGSASLRPANEFDTRFEARAVVWHDENFTILPSLPEMPNGSAEAINNKDEIVGTVVPSISTLLLTISTGGPLSARMVLWTREAGGWQVTDTQVELGELGGVSDINDAGQVVGDITADSPDGGQATDAFVWDKGVLTRLPKLAGRRARAEAINESGRIVGSAEPELVPPLDFTTRHAVLWEAGQIVDLGTLAGQWSVANDINDLGEIVGSSSNGSSGDFDRRAVLWREGQLIDLNTLLPEDLGIVLSGALLINNAGQIACVGYFVETGPARTHVFLLDPDGG